MLLQLGQASRHGAVDRPQPGLERADGPTLELLLLAGDLLEQFRDRIREQLHPVDLEVVGHFVHVDADAGQLAQHLAGAVHVLEQTRPYLAVLFEGHHGLLRHGIDRFRADQLLDVHHVAVVRILGTGAGPQAALHPSTMFPESGEFRFVEDALERLVRHFRVGDGSFAE